MENNKRYFICYELGIHHTTIETNQNDFLEVINDLSKEFTIYKLKDDSNPYTEVYNIQNYYGELQTVGFVQNFPCA